MAGYPGSGPPNKYHIPYVPAHLLQSIYHQKHNQNPYRPAPPAWMPKRVENYYHGLSNMQNGGGGNVQTALSMVVPNHPSGRPNPNMQRVTPVSNTSVLRVPSVPNTARLRVQGTGSNMPPSSSHQSSRKRTRESQDNQSNIKKKRTQNSAASTATHPSNEPSSSNRQMESNKRTSLIRDEDLIANAVEEYINKEVEDYINEDVSFSDEKSRSKSKHAVPKKETNSSKQRAPSSSSSALSDQRTAKSSSIDSKPSTSSANSIEATSDRDSNLPLKDGALTPPNLVRTGVKRKASGTSLTHSAPPAVQVKQRPRLDAVTDEDHDCIQLLDTPTSSRQSNNQRRNSLPAKSVDMLTHQIMERYHEFKQQDADLNRKEDMRIQLENIIHEVMPHTMLFLVGSTRNCFGTRTSDADMCLMVCDGEMNQKRDARNILYQLRGYLTERCHFMRQVQVIPAKVPILKFRHRYSGLECDLNINNATGIRNTHLLQAYAKLDSRVAPLVLMVKLWASSAGINDASQGTLSSYSLVLMVLNYLQVRCKPPVLPALQQRYSSTFTIYSDVRDFHNVSPKTPLPSHINYQSQNKQDVGALLRGFFEYYAREFKFNSSVMSIRLGKVLRLQDVARVQGDWLNKYILIEEPFDQTNTARAVYTVQKFNMIKRRFSEACSKFKSGGPSMKLNKVIAK